MQLPMTRARLERGDAAARAGVALILAAALAASSVQAAENVERDDAAASRADAEAARAKGERAQNEAEAKREKAEQDRQAEKQRQEKAELDAKLADAQKRLEKAASEVAQLSQQIATRVVENLNWSLPGMTRRTVIGVQLAPGTKAGEGAKV